MKSISAALAALVLSAPALAADPSPAKDAETGYSEVQLSRYCAKLEQSEQAYGAYVNRMKKMHPYYGFEDLGGTSNGRVTPRLRCPVSVPMVQAKESDPAPATAEAVVEAR
jgi:hypothetical protein